MKDFVKRMVEEHSALKIKVVKLENFLTKNDYVNEITNIANNTTQAELLDNMDKNLDMRVQLLYMRGYLNTLEHRLAMEGVVYDDEAKAYAEIVARVNTDKLNENNA